MAPRDDGRKERHSGDPKSSVRAPPKKEGGGGRFTMGRATDYQGGATVDRDDPNYDPDERRVDPDDGVAYKYEELAAFYKGKFDQQAIAEYWEYECTPAKRKGRKEKAEYGPSLAESAAKAKVEAVDKARARWQPKRLTHEELIPKVSKVIPYYPFKKMDKFYDVQGLLHVPNLFDQVCNVIANRVQKSGAKKLVAFDGKGFLFMTVAMKAGLPFVLLRKSGKLPNAIAGDTFMNSRDKAEVLTVQKGAIKDGESVVLIDDLLAGGQTLVAGIELMKKCNAEVAECICLVEVKAGGARAKATEAGAKSMWSFISDDTLNTKADLPTGYVDDGSS